MSSDSRLLDSPLQMLIWGGRRRFSRFQAIRAIAGGGVSASNGRVRQWAADPIGTAILAEHGPRSLHSLFHRRAGKYKY
jgi:hypothetical protein